MQVSGAQIGIFWDYENCPAPSNMSGYDVVASIRDLGHAFGSIKHLKAYTEFSEQTRSMCLRSELQSSGVSIIDCPHNGRKNVADQMMIADMLTFAMDNPLASSTTIMLISGDRDFAYVLSVLRLRMYRVVVVSPSLPGAHISLKSQASHFLEWHRVISSASKEETIPSLLEYRKNEGVTRTRRPSHCKSNSSIARTSDCVNADTSHTGSTVPFYVHLEANNSQCSRSEANDVKLTPTTRPQQPPPQPPSSQGSLSADSDSPPLPATVSHVDTDLRRGPPVYSAAISTSTDQSPTLTATDSHPEVGTEVSPQSIYVPTSRGGHSSSPPTPKASSLSSSPAYLSRPQSAAPSIPVPAPSLSPAPVLASPAPSIPVSTPPVPAPSLSPAPVLASPAPSIPVSTPPLKWSWGSVTAPPFHPPAPIAPSTPASTSLSPSCPAAPIVPSIPVSTSVLPPSVAAPVVPPTPVSAPPTSHSEVPAPYQPLVQILELHRSKGVQRPSRSIVATELVKRDKLAYRKAGVQRFRDYTMSAETKGLIQLGGKEGDAWISLHPKFHGGV